MSTLSIKQLTKEFPTREEPLVILSGVDLELNSGENVAVIGPSGSGKSTLLHIAGTLDAPSSGTVKLDDTNPFELNEQRLAKFRNDHIGFIFQEHHLLPQLSVVENVLVPALAFGTAGKDDIRRAEELVERVGLSERKDHRPAELSGGERQRVAVARALLRKPMLILADEPTGSLDQNNASSVGSLLLEINQAEQTMLITVTHSMALASTFQSAYRLNGGKLEPTDSQSTTTAAGT